MRYILIIYFLILTISSNGQKTTCFDHDLKNEINDSIITFRKGNLISINPKDNQQTTRIFKGKTKFSYTDSILGQEYLFIDSLDNAKGWLIIDKSRKRVNYIDQETIFVYNTADKKCLIIKTKNCGFDIFTWNKKICGFSEPSYNFENGYISIIKNKRCRKNIKLFIDTEVGIIKKTMIKNPSH